MEPISRRKYQTVYDHLVDGIESGRYQPARRLPSERNLAVELGVNVATVRRAFRDLVDSGVIEKRIGDGTYLTGIRDAACINIVISDYQGEFQEKIAELAQAECDRQKLRCRIVRLGSGQVVMFLRTAIELRQPSLLLGDGLLSSAAIREVASAAWLFTVLANRLDQNGIPSVIGDDNHGIRMLTNRLRALGHTRIALLHNHSGHPIENIQIAVWRSAVGEGSPELRAGVPSGAHPAEYAFQAIARALARKERFSALICLNDELAKGALAAFAEHGIRVPRQMSVVSIGDTPFCRDSDPPLTALNPNLGEHIRQGFDLLARNRLRSTAPELLRLVEPALVIRKSDLSISSTPKSIQEVHA